MLWLTLIVAETISASSGIGYLAMNAREFLQTDVVVLAIVMYAILETGGAVVGGMAGGAAAGAVAGSMFGPLGTFIGAGIGAAVGTYLGQRAGDVAYEKFNGERAEQ